jgi:hypothetical protein
MTRLELSFCVLLQNIKAAVLGLNNISKDSLHPSLCPFTKAKDFKPL